MNARTEPTGGNLSPVERMAFVLKLFDMWRKLGPEDRLKVVEELEALAAEQKRRDELAS